MEAILQNCIMSRRINMSLRHIYINQEPGGPVGTCSTTHDTAEIQQNHYHEELIIHIIKNTHTLNN